jgi:hypothetical protein
MERTLVVVLTATHVRSRLRAVAPFPGAPCDDCGTDPSRRRRAEGHGSEGRPAPTPSSGRSGSRLGDRLHGDDRDDTTRLLRESGELRALDGLRPGPTRSSSDLRRPSSRSIGERRQLIYAFGLAAASRQPRYTIRPPSATVSTRRGRDAAPQAGCTPKPRPPRA